MQEGHRGGGGGGGGGGAVGMKTNPPRSLGLPQQFRPCALATFTVKHDQTGRLNSVHPTTGRTNQSPLSPSPTFSNTPGTGTATQTVPPPAPRHIPCECNLCTEGPAPNHSVKNKQQTGFTQVEPCRLPPCTQRV